jgi:hypothetical protein
VAAHHHAHHPARIRGHPHHERRVDRPDLPIEGPIQYDAAIDPEVARVKLRMGNPWCWSPALLAIERVEHSDVGVRIWASSRRNAAS